MFFATLAIVALAFGASAATTKPKPTTPPTAFNITSLTVNGSGCPAGSAAYTLSADHTAVTITFSEFAASVGPGISIVASRSNCQVTLGISVPPGFTFGVTNVDYRGYYALDNKVTASQMSSYYWATAAGHVGFSWHTSGVHAAFAANARSNLTGTLAGADYTFRDTFDLASTVLAPCGTTSVLNINSAISVSNAANTKGSGFITDDSIDASLITTFNFQWLTC